MDTGTQLTIAYVTSTGAQGSDYPIMTIALKLSPSMVVGTSEQFGLDPSSTWNLGPLGTATMKPISPATVTVGGSISITNVVPGGGILPAGTAVTIQGIGFQSGTQVQLSNVSLSSIQVIDSQNIQIVLAADTDMTGKKIQVVNPDGSQDTYFSYLRGVPLGSSSRALLSTALPIFSSVTHSEASFAAAMFANSQQFSGAAVQNQNVTPVSVTFTLFSAANSPLGTSTVVIPSGSYFMRETSELTQGVAPPSGSYLAVTASQPVEAFGFLGDDSAGTVVPMPYLASQP